MNRSQFTTALLLIAILAPVMLLNAPALADDSFQVSATVDLDAVSVGEPVRLTLVAESPADVRAELPALTGELGPFLVRDRVGPIASLRGDRRRTTMTVTLIGLDGGELEIPALDVTFVPARGEEPLTKPTEPLTITVSSLIGDEFDPREFADVKPVATVPISRLTLLLIVAGVIGAVVLLVLAVLIWIVVRGGSGETPGPGPGRWALDALDELDTEDLPGTGRGLEFQTRLTDVLRTYIERRFHVMAPEQTTDEFLRVAVAHPALGAQHGHELGGVLRAADLVKFARQVATTEACAAAMTITRQFVRETADDLPRAVPPSAPATPRPTVGGAA